MAHAPWHDPIRHAWADSTGPHYLPSARSREQYATVLAACSAAMPGATAAQFTTHAPAWLASQVDLKPSSRKAYAAALRAAARVLGVTLTTIPRIHVPDALPRPIETPTLLTILRFVRDWSVRAPNDAAPALLMLCRHGVRNSEACSLTRAQLVLGESLTAVQVQSKRGPLREVPLEKLGATVLRRYLDTLPPAQVMLFPEWTRHRLAAVWRELRATLGLPDTITGVHALRHTFLTNLHESGEDILTLQRLGGHRDIRSTMLYTRVSNARTQAAVNKLPSLEDTS